VVVSLLHLVTTPYHSIFKCFIRGLMDSLIWGPIATTTNLSSKYTSDVNNDRNVALLCSSLNSMAEPPDNAMMLEPCANHSRTSCESM
jgi:hypothetical protein